MSQRRIIATRAWHLGNIKSLELLDILALLHCSITQLQPGLDFQPVKLCPIVTARGAGAKKPGARAPGFGESSETYLAETSCRDFSTCWSGDRPSALEDSVAMIFPSLPIT